LIYFLQFTRETYKVGVMQTFVLEGGILYM